MGIQVARLMQEYRGLPERISPADLPRWWRVGVLCDRFNLSPTVYWHAFRVNERRMPGGLCLNNLSAEYWATRWCPDAAHQSVIEAEASMPSCRIVQNDTDWAMTKIFENTGRLVVDDDAMPVLRTTIYRIENYIKLCLAPSDPEVLRQFGVEACQQLENNPEIEEEVFSGKYGFNLQAIKAARAKFWNQINPKPKRTWYPA